MSKGDPIADLLAKLGTPAGHEAIARAFGAAPTTFELELSADASGPAASYVVALGAGGARIAAGELERAVAPERLRVTAPRAVFARIVEQPGGYIGAMMTGQLRQAGSQLLGMKLATLLGLLSTVPAPDTAPEPAAHAPAAPRAWRFAVVPRSERRVPAAGWKGRLEIQPALLARLFGPPADGVHWRSSGTYRFVAAATDADLEPVGIDVFDEDQVFEATDREEDRRAAAFWSSAEAWPFELAASDPAVASPFLTWLTEQIDLGSRDLVDAEAARARELMAAGDLRAAQRALWKAWELVAQDRQLEGRSARELRAVKAELEARKSGA